MQQLSIDQLVFKGTHNSYSCKGEDDLDPACMGHPVDVQIDDFGVWALELDYGVRRIAGTPTALVGHDRPGHGTCFMPDGFELVRLLRAIRDARAIREAYRPAL